MIYERLIMPGKDMSPTPWLATAWKVVSPTVRVLNLRRDVKFQDGKQLTADAVVFSEESEQIYREQGLEAFSSHERDNARTSLKEGPMAKLLKTLALMQREHKGDRPAVRIAIITARGSPSHERVIRTLREWNVQVDEAFFLGGLKKKGDILKAFGAHIFFDDQDIHLVSARKVVPSARVPYKTSSPLRKK